MTTSMPQKPQLKKETNLPFSLYRNIALSFVFLTALLVVIILFFSLGKAMIIIQAQREEVITDFMVTLRKDKGEAKQDLISQWLEVEVSGSQEFNSSGLKKLSSTSWGKVTIINNYIKAQPLVARTRLLTPSRDLFRITESVIVPPQSKVITEVYPDNPALAKEIKPTKMTIPGLWPGLQDKIYALSPLPLKPRQSEVKIILNEDITQGKDKFINDLTAKADLDLKNKAKDSFFKEIQVVTKDLNDLQIDGKPGQEKEKFNISGKVKFKGALFDKEKMLELAKAQLEESLGPKQELLSILPQSLIWNLEKFDEKLPSAVLKGSLKGIARSRLSDPLLNKENLAGLNEKEVKDYLISNIRGIKNVEVRFWPFWVKSVPRLKDRIEIAIEN